MKANSSLVVSYASSSFSCQCFSSLDPPPPSPLTVANGTHPPQIPRTLEPMSPLVDLFVCSVRGWPACLYFRHPVPASGRAVRPGLRGEPASLRLLVRAAPLVVPCLAPSAIGPTFRYGWSWSLSLSLCTCVLTPPPPPTTPPIVACNLRYQQLGGGKLKSSCASCC